MVDQGDGPLACLGGLGRCGAVAAEQLHQSRGKLFSGAPGSLALEGMPIAVVEAQQLMQPDGTVVCPWRPLRPSDSLIDTVVIDTVVFAQGMPVGRVGAILASAARL